MDPNKQYVKILLVGDEGVGKTSIVIALATEEPPLLVPAKAHDLYITGEVTNQTLPALIVDTCSSIDIYLVPEQTIEEIKENIVDSDVICVVFSLKNEKTRERVADYWLPFIEDKYKPVADQVDLTDDIDMFYIHEKYPQVEGYFRVSAIDLSNLVESFQFAQKTVLQPLKPLIDMDTKEVSPAFEKAIKRIFKVIMD
ncbi:Mitochondrial Rho GTPase 2 [Thelohanellus kitauei]|uniref:Mitochondrial Rho GTPase 2 n=1 Tax=Thelohanellus kitauei TaxID=669202 RepID=A0A0C2ICB3_THEKT|nr:Mitochondrial Rho GTPase 2 [Thelohanellus kitauei]